MYCNGKGNRLKILREAAGIKQSELAQLCGLSERTISRIESKSEYKCSEQIITSIADYFCVPTDLLLGRMQYEDAKAIWQKIEHTSLYRKYLACMHQNELLPEAEYYWISITDDNSVRGVTTLVSPTLGMMQKIHINASIATLRRLYKRLMVINKQEEADVVIWFGGTALVEANVFENPENYFPQQVHFRSGGGRNLQK